MTARTTEADLVELVSSKAWQVHQHPQLMEISMIIAGTVERIVDVMKHQGVLMKCQSEFQHLALLRVVV